ncbi:MAG: type IV pilus modification PilV family protein [Peptococcales bacterium]|jgi:type II secretion system protein I
MNNQKGMTLVELMVAVVIISLALITMMNMFDLGLNTTIKAKKETKAVTLAQIKMEEAKYKLNQGESPRVTRTEFTEVENQGYEYEVEVSGDSLKTIEVIVYYDDKSVKLMTKLGER